MPGIRPRTGVAELEERDTHSPHCALQAAMGRKGVHQFEFSVRGVVHTLPACPGRLAWTCP